MQETFWRTGHLKLWKVARSCFFKDAFCVWQTELNQESLQLWKLCEENAIDSLKRGLKNKNPILNSL